MRISGRNQIRARLGRRSVLPLFVMVGWVSADHSAWADAILPYSERTHGYSAWDSAVRGDLRTVGMAGAMVGLADSRFGSIDNPAGISMTLDSSGVDFTGNEIHDGYIQSYTSSIQSNSFIGTVADYPWGFGYANWSPQNEGEIQRLGALDGPLIFPSVTTREQRISVSRLFLGNKLSVGAHFSVGQVSEGLGLKDSPELDVNQQLQAYGGGIGILVQLQNRWLLGLNYSLPMTYEVAETPLASPGVKSFFQNAYAPHRLGLGLGWVPNRFFRAGAGLYIVGGTPKTALVSDDRRLVGDTVTFQPRVGASYTFIEYKELKGVLSLGSYLEVLRIQGVFGRIHGTASLELKTWIFNFGWGLDESRLYQNFIYSAGLDITLIMRKLDLIPPEDRPPHGGMAPSPFRLSEDGLPRPLMQHYESSRSENLLEIGRRFPERLRKRIETAPEGLKQFQGELIDTIESLPGGIKEELDQVRGKRRK